MSMISELKKMPAHGLIEGKCANCKKPVYESLFTLDDAYSVWLGKCPYCGALNFLSMNHGLRGYSSSSMFLELPTEEEKQANELPADCPTRGVAGVPADWHGSPLGELLHKISGDES